MLVPMDKTTWVCDVGDAEKVAERTIVISAYRDGEHVEVVGRLTDERPQRRPGVPDGSMHDMELCLKVRRADFEITAVRATMETTPHLDCTAIEPAFQQLVGLSVARGYSRAV
jgi:Protein of unknown function (DUF2889)